MAPQTGRRPQTLIVTDACLIDGKHTEIDTVLEHVEHGRAMDLLSSARFRIAEGAEDIAAARKRASDRVKAAALAAKAAAAPPPAPQPPAPPA